MLRLRLLGELGLELDGVAVPPPTGRPARALLGWLALNPGLHARSRLAGRLWPDVLDESARASLRTALWELGRVLSHHRDALATTREEVGLAPDVWVDVRTFEELVAAGRLDEAIELCRGELLRGLDDDWAYDARDEHREKVASVLTRLADEAERAGDLEAAVRRSRERVAVEPTSEEATRALIRRLAAAGDRAAALSAYARLRERLRRELNVVPSPETRALVEGLRREAEPEVVTEQLSLPPPLARGQPRLFVGRERELRVLREAWSAAGTGERQLVLVAGEAGIGKTRLVAEFARSVHAEGANVLIGRAYEEALAAYQPFLEALRPYLADAADLARLVPGFGAGNGDDQLADVRLRLFDAVDSLLASISGERPLLLVLEDVHWADKATLLLLEYLSRAPERARLLVIATYRGTDVDPVHPLAVTLAEFRRERLGQRIGLPGLGRPEVAALVAAEFGDEWSATIAARVHRESDGNPFFVEEILRHIAGSGLIDGAVLADDAELGVPEGVKEVIGARVARVGADAARVLTLASVIGREFTFAELAALVTDVEEDRLLDALEEGLRAWLIREESGPAPRYGFVHALVCEALYDGLTAARRRQLHLLAAEALERLYGDDPERLGDLAHHLYRSASPATAERAAEYATRAGELALGQLAYEEAAAHFERALRSLALVDGPRRLERVELLLALGDARIRGGDREQGRRAFARAADAARALHRPDLLARAALGFGGIGVTITAPDPAVVDLLEEALRSVGPSEGDIRARLLARLAVEVNQTKRDRSESLSADAIALARTTGEARTLVATLNARHVALPAPAHVQERLAIADEMVALARRTGDTVAELQGRHWRVLDLLQLGDLAAFERELEAYTLLAREARLQVYEWYAPMWRATLAMLRGPLDDVRQLWSDALALGRRAQDANAEIFFRSIDRYFLPLEESRPEDADLEWVRAGISRPEVDWVYRMGVAKILAERGRLEEAKSEFDVVGARGFGALPRDVHFFSLIAEAAALASRFGDVARAEELYDLNLPYRSLMIVHPRGHYCYGWAEHYLGVAATTLSRWRAAAAHYEAALEHERRWGAWRQVCRTLCAYAEMLLARGGPGDRDRAESFAVEAMHTAAQVEAANLVERAKALTREASLARA